MKLLKKVTKPVTKTVTVDEPNGINVYLTERQVSMITALLGVVMLKTLPDDEYRRDCEKAYDTLYNECHEFLYLNCNEIHFRV